MIYSIALYLYALAVVLVSPFRKKAWLMVERAMEYFPYLAEKHPPGGNVCLVSCRFPGRVRTGASADGAVAAGASGVQDIADLFLSFGL